MKRVLEFPANHQLPEAFVEALEKAFYDDPLHTAVQAELCLGWHEAHERIMELAFFLFVCYRYPDTPLAVPPRLDPVWHVFLAREEEYKAYCTSCFGGVIEHHPYETGETREIEISRTLACVGITFGGRFARRWSGAAQCDGMFKAAV